jgi:hypothetical protein
MVFRAIPAPAIVRQRVHPRVGLALLQSSSFPRRPDLPRALACLKLRTPSLGFRSSSRRQFSESTHGEHPGSPLFRPQRFARSRRLTPRCTFADLFRSAATSRILRSGVPPPTQLHHLVGGHALSPLAPRLYRRLPDDAKPRRVDLRTLFQVGIRSAAQGFSPGHRPCPVASVSFGLLLPTLPLL